MGISMSSFIIISDLIAIAFQMVFETDVAMDDKSNHQIGYF